MFSRSKHGIKNQEDFPSKTEDTKTHPPSHDTSRFKRNRASGDLRIERVCDTPRVSQRACEIRGVCTWCANDTCLCDTPIGDFRGNVG